MNRLLPRVGLAFLLLLVALILAVVVARSLFSNYLRSEAFRHSLGEAAAHTLGASTADFSPLQFDGFLVYGQNFRATRDDGGAFSTMDADQLRASLDWHGILDHSVQIDELTVQRLTVAPPSQTTAVPAPIGPSNPAPAFASAPSPWRVDLRKAVINEANWQWSADPAAGLTRVALTLTPAGQDAWVIEAQGGAVRQPGWPTLDLENATLRWQNPTLYINSSSLRGGSGQFAVTGSVQARSSVDLQVQLANVDIQPLLTPDWRERLSGALAGTANVHAPLGPARDSAAPASGIAVSGSLSLANGRLTALPILDQIGLFTHTERFRQMELSRASADFTHTADRLEIRNMIVESEGLMRVEGAYTIENGEISGVFRVGLTPSTLQWIPGSQEQVFTVSGEGYRWTTMHLSGPANHPVDDLTPRLVAATGGAVIQGAEGAVRKAAQSALDLLFH
jgi:hypothetical protein